MSTLSPLDQCLNHTPDVVTSNAIVAAYLWGGLVPWNLPRSRSSGLGTTAADLNVRRPQLVFAETLRHSTPTCLHSFPRGVSSLFFLLLGSIPVSKGELS